MNKRVVSFFMSVAILLSSIVGVFPTQASAAEPVKETDSIIRIEGTDRYKTAVEISQDVFPEGSKEAVIASGEKFSDALVGGNLAAHIDGPILLVRENDIPEEIGKELNRLGLETIYIVGGEHSISNTVASALKDHAGKVERLSGDNRYLTSVDVADKMVKEGAVEGVAYASGQNFPDALAGSALLAHLGNYTLILTDGKNIPEGAPDSENKIVFGGPSLINIAELENVTRYGEKDRFLTAIDIAYKGFKEYHTVILVDGTNYPDALTAVSLAKKYDAPILLTYPELITEETLEAMNGLDKIIIVGGKNSVSEKVKDQIVNSLLPEKPVDPEDTEKPVDPEDTEKPVDPEDTEKPVDPEDTEKPVDPEDTEKPVDPEDTEKPAKPVDKTDLDKAISDAQAKQTDGKDYTEESLNALKEAITKAEAVQTNDKASQKEVDDAKEALNKAIEDLVNLSEFELKDFIIEGNVIKGFSESGKEKNKVLKELTIPSKGGKGQTIDTIGRSAFAQAKIEKLILPETIVTIENGAFLGTGLKEVELNEGLENIGERAFAGANNKKNEIETLTIPSTIKHIGDSAFAENGMKELVIKEGVTRLTEGAFSHNKLEKVTLPSTLKEIEKYAFVVNNLNEINLPDGLEVIAPKAFCRNKFNSIEIPNSLERFDPTSWRINPGIKEPDSKFIIRLRDEIKIDDLGGIELEDKLSDLVKVRPAIHRGSIYEDFTLLDIVNWEQVSIEDGHAVFHATFTQLSQEELEGILDGNNDGSGNQSVVDHLKKMRLEVKVDLTEVSDEDNTEFFTVEGNKITGLSEKGKEKVGQDGVLNIPEIPGVDTISANAFRINKEKPIKLKEVSIDGSIKTIENAAFGLQTTLTKLKLNEGIETIGNQAFMAHSIESLEIPASVKTIGVQAFYPTKDAGITSLVLNEGLESIERGAFTNNKIEEVKIPNSVTSIEGVAFQKNNIKFVDVGSGLKKLEDTIFKGNPIERVLIPNTIEQIHVGTFDSSGEISIEFKDTIEGINAENINEKVNLPLKIEYPTGRTETALAEIISWEEKDGYFSPVFEEMTDNTTLGNFEYYIFKLTSEGASGGETDPGEENPDLPAGEFIKSVDSFEIKDGVVLGFSEKGKEEFKTVKSLAIPRKDKEGNLVTKVEANAFKAEDEEKINELVLPDTLVEIGMIAFQGNEIEEVILPDSIETLGNGCFANSGVKKLKFPSDENNKLKVIPQGAFSLSNIEELIIPKGVTEIARNAFTDAKSLEKLVLPNTLETIGQASFNVCSSLSSVRIPGSVKEVGKSAFANGGISELIIEEGVEAILAKAFYYNTLGTVNIPTSVNKLHEKSFEKNPNIFVEYQVLKDALEAANAIENPSEELTNLIEEANKFSAIKEDVLDNKTLEKANEHAEKIYNEIQASQAVETIQVIGVDSAA